MKKTLGSVLCKALVAAFIAVGFMIIRPSATYAETQTAITGPDRLFVGQHGTFTFTYTFDVNIEDDYEKQVYASQARFSDYQEGLNAENLTREFRGNQMIETVRAQNQKDMEMLFKDVKFNNKKLADLPEPIWNGHDFIAWFTAATGGTQVTTNTVFLSSDTIFAHWEGEPTPPSPTPTPRTRPRDDDDDDSHEESRTSIAEPSWTPAKAAATIAAEKAAKQQAAATQQAAVQTFLRTLATTKPTDGVGEARKVIVLDMTKVDILDPATVNLLTLNSKFEYYIKISDVGGLTNTVKIPANFNYRPFIKADGTMNIHEVLWSIVKSRIKKATPKGSLYMIR